MFKETQQRKIDLEEDELGMVELLVKFFYTFDYDNTPANTEMSALGLHASVYTIADKYEVLALKSTALARFKEVLVEFYDVGEVMVEATRDLTGFLPPPTCDTTLHDLVVEAWIIGGEVLSQDIGEEEVLSLFTEMTWLSTAFATRMLARSKSGRICGHRNDLITQAECLDKREKAVLHLRYNLQRGFLPQNGSAKEEEMSALDKILGQLESHGDLEPSIIRSTKIDRILKSISKLASIPKDKEFGFKRRSAKLFGIYNKRLEDDGGEITQSTVRQ
jgi:hypothetical protein